MRDGDDSDLVTDISPTSSGSVVVANTGAIRKMDSSVKITGSRFLVPLEKRSNTSSMIYFSPLESTRHKRFEVTNYTTNSPLSSPTPQIDLGFKNENKLEPIVSNTLSSKTTMEGFTLSGKGAMFLKTNTNKKVKNQDITVKSSSIEVENAKGYKSILRDTSLTDVRNRPESKVSDHETEDRKIVRFNFDASEESSDNEAENTAWDFAEVDNFVKNVEVTINKKSATELSDSHKSSSTEPTISGSSLASIFERKMERDKRIKPLYEDTDSESMPSVKSFNRELEDFTSMKSTMVQSRSHVQVGDSKNATVQCEDFNHHIESNQQLEPQISQVRKEMKFRQNVIEELTNSRANSVENSKKELKSDERKLSLNDQFDEDSNEFDMKIRNIRQQKLQDLIKILEEDVNDKKVEMERHHNLSVERLKQQLEDDFEEKHKALVKEQRIAEESLQQNHKTMLEELERDLKTDEELIRKDHASALTQMREKLSRELELERQRMRETGENRVYEKIRCEKRLLEDKYRCLKDKYVRLKTDVKNSLERRNQRRELQSIATTGSETEQSNFNKNSADSPLPVPSKLGDIGKPPILLPPTKNRKLTRDRTQNSEKKLKNFGAAVKYLSHIQQQYQDDTTSISQSDTTISNKLMLTSSVLPTPTNDNGNFDSEALRLGLKNNNNCDAHSRQGNKLFTCTKSPWTTRLDSGHIRCDDAQLRSRIPVENLRRQLQKLEDLEDQFPENSLSTTYHLRYPFKFDSSKEQADGSSSELEFFKHRIHLERDSVRRAKDSLRNQRIEFRARQREIKYRHKNAANHTIDQLIQEEKELTEMEVNLHRTRALLGEKVIRLRHLEQSLQRMCATDNLLLSHLISDEKCYNCEDATISDLSSHSSSGISSTDFAGNKHPENAKHKEMYQESSEIILSLENLNAEIREIWEALSKQQPHGNFCLFKI